MRNGCWLCRDVLINRLSPKMPLLCAEKAASRSKTLSARLQRRMHFTRRGRVMLAYFYFKQSAFSALLHSYRPDRRLSLRRSVRVAGGVRLYPPPLRHLNRTIILDLLGRQYSSHIFAVYCVEYARRLCDPYGVFCVRAYEWFSISGYRRQPTCRIVTTIDTKTCSKQHSMYITLLQLSVEVAMTNPKVFVIATRVFISIVSHLCRFHYLRDS